MSEIELILPKSGDVDLVLDVRREPDVLVRACGTVAFVLLVVWERSLDRAESREFVNKKIAAKRASQA